MSLNVLVVNDDGFDAEGINVLRQALLDAGYGVTLVGPAEQQSGRGTLVNADRLFEPLDIVQFGPNAFSVDGSPTVVSLAALNVVLADNPPDLLISGINDGENVGLSAVVSGTISAAIRGLVEGVPSIAVSAEIDDEVFAEATFATAAAFTVDVVEALEANQAQTGVLLPSYDGFQTGLNINVPDTASADDFAVTRFDEVVATEFMIGEREDGFGTVIGEGAPNDLAISEGSQFLQDVIAVTPIDQDWTASPSVREGIEARIGSEVFVEEGAVVDDTPTVEALEILLINDDGFDSEGITALREALEAAGHDVTLIAPAENASGSGTAVTIQRGAFEITAFGEGGATQDVTTFEDLEGFDTFSVAATPTSTAEVAFGTVFADEQPDLVISGINEGANLGTTALSSGTVGAAVEALTRGVPAIAISAGVDLLEAETGFPSTVALYPFAADFAVELIDQLIATAPEGGPLLPAGNGLNVNVPLGEIAGVALTEFDDATPLAFDVGPISPLFGGDGETVGITLDLGIVTDNPESEGNLFQQGFVTITPFDGDYSADATLVEYVEDVLRGGELTPFPELDEADALPAAARTEADDTIFVGDGLSDVFVRFESEVAALTNSLIGFRVGEDGTPVDPEVLFAEVSSAETDPRFAGDALDPGDVATIGVLEEGERFGLALLSNGADALAGLPDDAELAFVEAEDGGLALAVDGERLGNDLFFATDPTPGDGVNEANADGADQAQVVGGFEADTGRYLVGFEDVTLARSDMDFNDVVVSVNFV